MQNPRYTELTIHTSHTEQYKTYNADKTLSTCGIFETDNIDKRGNTDNTYKTNRKYNTHRTYNIHKPRRTKNTNKRDNACIHT